MTKTWVGPVYLEPIEHIYIHRETKERFSSVTQCIHSLVNPFDEDAVAEAIVKQPLSRKKPKYHNMTKEMILEEWHRLNAVANEYGTMIHELIEEYLHKHKLLFPSDPFQKKILRAYDALEIDEGEVIWPERIMFSDEHKLAGTADLIIDIDDVYFDVGDWKGLPIDTPIFTDSGWKTMGTLTKSDRVYDMDGKLTNINHMSEITNKKCYKITFDNNEEIISDFEHRWLISFYNHGVMKDVVMTTEELKDYLNKLDESGKVNKGYLKPKVKISKPLDNDEIKLPIDPYVLGVWLGDGHSVDAKITNMYQSIWDEIKNRGFDVGDDVSQGNCGKAKTRTVFGLHEHLKELGLLNNKHIPDLYLQGSYKQRLDLLRGLMDADGHYNVKRKRFVMSSTRLKQVEYTNMLVASLGIKTTIIKYKKNACGKKIDCYDVCFTTDGLNVFLNREVGEIKYSTNAKKTFKNIISVEEVESTPTRCIEVDSETHTFLYGHSFSITHNTNISFDFYDSFGHKTMKKPLDHLQDCHYSVYSVQLSIYAYMYELETGRKCRQIWIGYWDREQETIIKIPIMYLKHEAKKVLDWHKYRTQFA
jgi:hypothetical protein